MGYDVKVDSFAGAQSAWHSQGYVKGELMTYDEVVGNTDLGRHFRKEARTNPYTGADIRSWDIFRDDNLWIATVGERHTMFDVDNTFKPFNDLMTAVMGKDAVYETGGTLEGGAKRWLLAYVGEGNVLGIDPIKKYVNAMDSIDGTMKFKIGPSNIRIVCRNTFGSASRELGTYTRKHTSGGEKAVKDDLGRLSNAIAQGDALMDCYNDLAQRAVDVTQTRNIIRGLFGIKPDVQHDDIPTVTKNRIDNVFDLFERNDDDAFPQFRGTAWGLFNAVTNYADHDIDVRLSTAKSSLGYTVETVRAYNALLGTGADLKATALDAILEQTANAPRVNGIKSYSFATQGANVLDDILNNLG